MAQLWQVLIVAAGLFLAVKLSQKPGNSELAVLRDALLHAEQQFSSTASAVGRPVEDTKVLVGFNAAVDLICRASEAYDVLGDKAAEDVTSGSNKGRSDDQAGIQSVSELWQEFFRHFSVGFAAERLYNDGDAYKGIVAKLKELPSSSSFVGGNAALMGMFLAEKGASVTLAAKVGPHLKQLLNETGVYTPDETLDGSDEYHIILEYATGDTIAGTSSPRANRFIFSHDRANGELRAMQHFESLMRSQQPDIVVISGLHMAETEPNRDDIVKNLRDLVEAVSDDVTIHLELASMSDEDYLRTIGVQFIPACDSLGLNEAELAHLVNSMGAPTAGRDFSTADAVADVADSLHWLLKKFRSYTDARLTRIHFHSLHFHMVASAAGAWKGAAASVVAGVLTCSRRACQLPDLQPMYRYRLPDLVEYSLSNDAEDGSLREARRLDYADPVQSWRRAQTEFAMAPVPVCRRPLKTVGLGDSISAAGLISTTKIYRRPVRQTQEKQQTSEVKEDSNPEL